MGFIRPGAPRNRHQDRIEGFIVLEDIRKELRKKPERLANIILNASKGEKKIGCGQYIETEVLSWSLRTVCPCTVVLQGKSPARFALASLPSLQGSALGGTASTPS